MKFAKFAKFANFRTLNKSNELREIKSASSEVRGPLGELKNKSLYLLEVRKFAKFAYLR